MSKKQEIIEVPEQIAPDSPLALLQRAIDNNTPVETIEKLMDLHDRWKTQKAKEAYDQAMAAFQADCPTIEKKKAGGKTKGGYVAYYYAPLESIVEQVKGLLQTHGFSYSFDTVTDQEKGMVTATCVAKHIQGHSEHSSFEVPLGTKTEIMSATQQTAAAITYAKRYAFCNAFGILTGDEDTDASKASVEPQIETEMPQGIGAIASNGFPIKENPVTKGLSPREQCIMAADSVIKDPQNSERVERMIEKVQTSEKLTTEDKDMLIPQLKTTLETMEDGSWISPKKKGVATI